jgi:hypothetical protein
MAMMRVTLLPSVRAPAVIAIPDLPGFGPSGRHEAQQAPRLREIRHVQFLHGQRIPRVAEGSDFVLRVLTLHGEQFPILGNKMTTGRDHSIEGRKGP